ncbi:MAG TPA: histidine phosphatase family protein [Oligoflexia bacterium]|nr:histidine phosphatase family protein [Oligoflexia bacterium]
MKLILIRHGAAQDAQEWQARGKNDELRPLTNAGRKKMRQAFRGVAKLAPNIELIISSPLLRARQTAEILHNEFPKAHLDESRLLSPGTSPLQMLEVVLAQQPGNVIALVGHEPNLGLFLGLLISGGCDALLRFKKGAACLVEFTGLPEKGRGRLCWFAAPATLRSLGE